MPTDSAPADETWLEERWQAVQARAAAELALPTADPAWAAAWSAALRASDFVHAVLQRDPALLGAQAWQELFLAPAGVTDRVAVAVAGCREEAAFMAALRRVRHREAVRLVLRSAARLDEVPATLRATSELYVALLDAALARAEADIAARHGLARDAAGAVQRLVVIGMGKLGGGELNFSSDIDLILAWPEAGRSDGAKPLDNEEYFVRLGRQLVHLLAQPGPEGIVARVDLRLRPFGSAGRLALSFAAMEQYYQREGRDWERFAWIKATPVAGDLAAGARLVELLRPFVYRRYLDFDAVAGLRALKAGIAAQVAREDLADDLKRGPGGIREIEFCVQLVQLIRGGREPELRVAGLLPALAACVARGFLEPALADTLREAYLFLRALENAVQMLADRQTHLLPPDAADIERIARSLGYPESAALGADLTRHRDAVERIFRDLLRPAAGTSAREVEPEDEALWQAARADALAAEAVAARGFLPGEAGRRALLVIARAAEVRMMSARSGARLDRLVPLLLADARATDAPLAALERLARLLQAIARRSAYLALLEEQPAARRHLADLFADSAFLAERVIAQPILLDDVLDPRLERLPLRRAEIAQEVGRSLDGLDEEGPEAALQRLHETRASLAFRLGLAFREHDASAPACARRLAGLAAAVTGEVLALARRELVERHGDLPGARDGAGFAVIGYGSLGAEELGFASDLDLVFIYDEALEAAQSDGPRPLEGVRWLQRLAQRVVHWLTLQQPGGRLYEVDTRLRPDGSRGMLVTSMASFAAYQESRAWIWERQALVRARPVAGDSRIGARFLACRAAVLGAGCDPAETRAEIVRMRERWRAERDRSDAAVVDLKQGRGGLLDLEFLLQFLVLAYAWEHSGLLASGSTPALLAAAAEAGVLDRETAEGLAAAHAGLLDAALRCTLDRRPRILPRSLAPQDAMSAIAAAVRAHGLDAEAVGEG